MKIGKKEFAAAFGAVLGFGVAGQASADVYGLSYLNIDNVGVMFRNADNSFAGGGAGRYTFSANQDAILNGSPDPADWQCQLHGHFPCAKQLFRAHAYPERHGAKCSACQRRGSRRG
jgi:hypothetical protein